MRPHFRFWPARLPREITTPQTTLFYNLEVSATRYPDKDAIRFFGARVTYRELLAQATAIAGWLQQVAGVQRGDRVLVILQNSPQHVAATYGVLRADAVVVPVNPMNRAEELRHLIADSGARVAICAADVYAYLKQANDSLPPEQQLTQVLATRYADVLPPDWVERTQAPLPAAWIQWLNDDPALPANVARWPDVIRAARVPAPALASGDDLAYLPYTSGTTGAPKGCMHTHRTILHNTVGGTVWGNGNADNVGLAVVPLFHVTGMQYGMHAPIYSGGTTVMLPRWDREVAAAMIAQHRVTHWTNIPTMIIDLLASPNAASFDLSSLKVIGGGGAAMPQAVAERLRERFGLVYQEGYGLTETAAPSHSNPLDRAKLQCLGMPFFNTDARIVDPDTLRELPPGEVGEIIIHGPQVFKGYWNAAGATQAAFCEFEGRRFFRSGDLGRMDEDGYFFLTDRLKRMINASGFKVWPAEVESLLYKHPAIAEACIIGTRDAYRGETVKAVVVLRHDAAGTTAEQIIDWCREHMAAYKVPRQIEFVDQLPKSGTGKVMWRALQERENSKG